MYTCQKWILLFRTACFKAYQLFGGQHLAQDLSSAGLEILEMRLQPDAPRPRATGAHLGPRPVGKIDLVRLLQKTVLVLHRENGKVGRKLVSAGHSTGIDRLNLVAHVFEKIAAQVIARDK